MNEETEQCSLLHPLSEEKQLTPIEQIRQISEKPALQEQAYIWLKDYSDEEKQAKLAKEAEALKRLENLGRFGVTYREKVQFYFGVLHYIMETWRGDDLDRPITWEQFRLLFCTMTEQYAHGKTYFD